MRPLRSLAIPLIVILGGCATTATSSPNPTVGPTQAATPSAQPSLPSSMAPASATPVPNDQDGVLSEAGLFVGSWSTEPARPEINALHDWILHIETADGAPVEGALVSVDGDMPAHGHGMPTDPEVTADLGGGDYRVEGMQFQMGGYWVVDVRVTIEAQTDVIRFGLDL